MLEKLRLVRLRDYFKKPEGRAAAHPHYLEIIVARTGQPAHTFRINLEHMKKIGMGLGIAAFAWFAGTFYVAYSHVSNMAAIARANSQAQKIELLTESNEKLSVEKQHMSEDLSSLQTRVEGLALRIHGLINQTGDRFPVEHQQGNQGGEAIPLTPENASMIAESEFEALDDRLNNVLPKLENTVAREISRPAGEPLQFSAPISSDYGLRDNPFGKGHEFHNGIDFVVDIGTPIMATAPGVVDGAGNEGAIGNRVSIDHGFGYRSVYGHMSKVAVKVGDHVKRGQLLGYSGSTGRSSGPHLHYTLYYKGRTIDPENYLQVN